MSLHCRTSADQAGASLIEVQIALLIFSVAVVGALSLQLATLRSSQSAMHSNIATALVRDYAEIVQVLQPSVGNMPLDSNSLTASSVDCVTLPCSAQQFGQAQQHDWLQRVKANLPGGRAVVCRDTTRPATDALPSWECNDQGDLLVLKLGWYSKHSSEEKAISNGQDRPRLVLALSGAMQGGAL